MIAPPWLSLLDETIGACLSHERTDLAERLRYRRARLLTPKLHVLVVGAAKQGKSQLVNALVNASVCAVGDDLATMAPTVIQHADEPSAVLVTDRAPAGPPALGRPMPALGQSLSDRIAVPIEDVARQTSGRADPALRGSVVTAEVGIPRQLLAAGMVLIDTPPTEVVGRTRPGASVADLDYDLRERTRKILREADRAFETADPQVTWNQFEDWLMESLTDTANANYGWLLDRFHWMAEKVAHSVPMPRGESLPEDIAELPADRLGVDEPEPPRLEPFTLGQKAFTALRSSYGGVLMFGLATSLAGLQLINPISLGAGVAFGGKGIRDESEGRLKRRQAAARAAAQRHIDDFYLAFSKDCKDMLRQAQRRLRDHFLEVTETLQDEAIAIAEKARQSIQADAVQVDARNRQIQRDLEKLVSLYQRVQALVTTAVAARGAGLEITA